MKPAQLPFDWPTSRKEHAPAAARELAPGASLLPGLALERAPRLVADLAGVLHTSPLRHMQTPGGHRMSVAMSNCGPLGWVTGLAGYRYAPLDPEHDRPWPKLPESFLQLATLAATRAGYPLFTPDACLVNQYAPGARMTLHQDKNEHDFTAPIVSVSLGLPATFLFGGLERNERPLRVPLDHGDVVVWGGPARLRFHGVLPLRDGHHPLLGPRRINLTFRLAGHALPQATYTRP